MSKHGKNRKNREFQARKTHGQPPGGQNFAADGAGTNGDAPSSKLKYDGKTIFVALVVLAFSAIVYGVVTQTSSSPILPSVSAAGNPSDNTAKVEGGYQVIHMNVTAAGWEPNRFVLKKGVPVKWVIDGQVLTGCNSGIKVPSLGLSFQNKKGEQTIEFTPTTAGTIPWSCLMGMIQGSFIVTDNVDTADPAQVQKALDSAPAIPKSKGGCGCGMM